MSFCAPPALRLAAGLVAVQGVGFVVLAVVQLVSFHADRAVLGVTVALFFVVYAAVLLLGARALLSCDGWPRGPVLITQLIELGLAWNLRSDVAVAAVLALVAIAVIAAMLHPASLEALADRPEEGRD